MEFFLHILPIILIFFIFYVLLILPQQRRERAHKEMLQGLRRGDGAVTVGGIHGTVVDIRENTVILNISADEKPMKVEISKNAIVKVKKSEQRVAKK
jgi:preprotein translocase subunit YajC